MLPLHTTRSSSLWGLAAWEKSGRPQAASALAPPAIILLAVAESLPGAFFFLRIHESGRSGQIRGLFIGSVVGTFFLAMLLPQNWFETFPYPSPLSWEFSDVAGIYPTIALLGLILIPLLFRESSFLARERAEHQQEKESAILSTRVASFWVSNGIALVIALVTFFVPSGFGTQSGQGSPVGAGRALSQRFIHRIFGFHLSRSRRPDPCSIPFSSLW